MEWIELWHCFATKLRDMKHALTELALAIKNLVGGFLVPWQVADFSALGLAGSSGTTAD
jgi:hypothetical protein